MAALYATHDRALTVLYADVEAHASSLREVFVGTAGSIVERTNASGFRFYAHQFYDGTGRKRERYVAGPVGAPDADDAAENLRGRIAETKDLVPSLRLLGREGFNVLNPMTYATLASLHNHGIFAAGGMLVGSHAFGALLNRLGVRAVPYATEDVDIARGAALAFDDPPEKGILGMLEDSGIEFVEVPQLDRKSPSTSFKQRGRSRFHVDLLAPLRGKQAAAVAVPELMAHATGLPYLGYLLGESQMAAVIAREGCCAVRIPLPERYAIHKLLVSRLRTGRDAKARRDILQASVLCAVLAETHSGAVETAMEQLPRSAMRRLGPAIDAASRLLENHPRALAELTRPDLGGRK